MRFRARSARTLASAVVPGPGLGPSWPIQLLSMSVGSGVVGRADRVRPAGRRVGLHIADVWRAPAVPWREFDFDFERCVSPQVTLCSEVWIESMHERSVTAR